VDSKFCQLGSLSTPFATDGTLFKASNLGGTAVTVGGIAYDADFSNLVGYQADLNYICYSGSDPDKANLLNSNTFQSNYGSYQTFAINLTGLTLGANYRVQMLMFGWGPGGADASLYGNDWADPLYYYVWTPSGEKQVTYEWTADTASRTIRVANWGNDGTTVMAYAVHQVPEPATLSMAALFGCGLLFIRRKGKV
jgi:hypothetical protein